MTQAQFGEFVQINFQQFLTKSSQLLCKAKGVMTSPSKHRKYIIEVLQDKKPVIRTYKRFTQFESLYELLKHSSPTHPLPEFPSRLQIFSKEQTRKSQFENLLNQIVNDYVKQNKAISQAIMKTIFDFLADHILKDKLRKDMIAKKKRQSHKNKQNLAHQMETFAMSQSGQRVVKHVTEPFDQQENFQQRVEPCTEQKAPSINKVLRKRSNSACEKLTIVDKAPELQQNVYDNEFQVKFANEEGWKTGFIEIKESAMYIFKTKLDNHFKTCIQLYRINVEFFKRNLNFFDHICDRLQLTLTRTFNQNQDILSLYHDYDSNKILIRKPCPENVSTEMVRFNILNLKDQIIEASYVQPICDHFDGVFNPIGKVFIFLHRIHCTWKQDQQKKRIWLRIKTGAFIHHATPVSYGSEVQLNQGFLIPVSNIFERISIECYTGNSKKDNGDIVGVFTFNMVELFTKMERPLIEKLEVRLEGEQNKQALETKLQVSIQNLSHLSSIYSNSYLSENDGMPNKQMSDIEDMEDFTTSINRILCIIGSVSLLARAFQRNVIRFKYPILGYAFFSWVMINVAFIPITYILKQLLIFALLLILYQQEHAHLLIKYLMDQYIFTHLHPSFRAPEVLATDQITDLKWSHQMKQIAEDYRLHNGNLEKKQDKARTIYEFKVHDRVFVVKYDEKSFFEKIEAVGRLLNNIYQVVNTLAFILEKIGNLFSWIDFRKTLFVCLLISISAGFTSIAIFQLLICVVCATKLINGTCYYPLKHYQRNRTFAVYAMRYILQNSFHEIIGAKNIHKDMNYVELNEYISNLSFPIDDESAEQKLRVEMQRIMGVYLEKEAVMKKVSKQSKLKLVYLIDMIQTCEKKLKLNFIAGEQGFTNQFQQLKLETKEVQDIDDWLKEAATNFVLNIPSKIFMIFHKNQLLKIEKAQAKQNSPEQASQPLESKKQDSSKINQKQECPQEREQINVGVQEEEATKQKLVMSKQKSEE